MKKRLAILLLMSLGIAQAQQKTVKEFESNINVPLNFTEAAVFEKNVYNDSSLHTALKPYSYQTIGAAIQKKENVTSLQLHKKSWLGNYLFNGYLFDVKGKDYWVTADFLLDIQAGRDNTSVGTTLKNGRIIDLKGQIGDKVTFQATTYENQAKFTEYINEYVKINQPEDASGLMPGIGKTKAFGETGFDFAMSTGYVNYKPNKFFNFQLGHGKNFIGDGYRSVLLSDVASPYTYGKLTTTVGKVQYTNIWTWLKDFNFSIDADPANNAGHKRKYGVFHHLSWNVSNRLNVGLFEGIISDNSGTSGAPNAEFFNPIIFYKNIEFNNGEDSGSGVVGLNTKFKLFKDSYLYGQFLLDEFSADKFFTNEGYWANKYAYQVGLRFFDVLNVKGLNFLAEYNSAKPFTYSHEKQHNYAHFGQPLAHLWGANFNEFVMIGTYHHKRWLLSSKVVTGKKGFDFDPNTVSNGGNIFINSTKRASDKGHRVLQGNLSNLLHLESEVSYLVNPVKNMRVFAGFLYRKFDSEADITQVGIDPESTGVVFNTPKTVWLMFGIKSDLFNNYKDY